MIACAYIYKQAHGRVTIVERQTGMLGTFHPALKSGQAPAARWCSSPNRRSYLDNLARRTDRVRQAKALEDRRQIIRAPTVSQGETDSHRLRVLAAWQPLRNQAEHLLDVIINIEFLQKHFEQVR